MSRAAPMRAAFALLATLLLAPAAAAQVPHYGADLEHFDYPWPVHWFDAEAQGGKVRMAYLDVAPAGPANGRTAVLLHGKNFCAATWQDTIATLAAEGFRIIAPDQIGFCKSSKPAGFQYSFHTLADLTDRLLTEAGVEDFTLIGHSTGGMLGIRYALLHPERVSQLVLVNPLGLNDTIAEGVPYAPLSQLRAAEAETDEASIRAYQRRVYYQGEWNARYEQWVDMLAGQYASEAGDTVREAQARTSDMIQTQPTAHELDRLQVPTTLIIGQEDLTAFRAAAAPEAVRDQVRTVPEAAEEAVERIQGAAIMRLPGLGHSPQVEAPDRFHRALLDALATPGTPQTNRQPDDTTP